MSRYRLEVEFLEDRSLPSAVTLITTLYQDFLGRAPSTNEMLADLHQLSAGATPMAVASQVANSVEFFDRQVTQDYVNLLGREPSQAELLGWQAGKQAGLSTQQALAEFLSSDEYFRRQGATAASWLNGVYQDVLHRAPDATGETAFLGLADQAGGRMAVARDIVFSPEGEQAAVNDAYSLLLHRPADAQALNSWDDQLNNGLPLSQLLASLASSPEFQNQAATNQGTAPTIGMGTPR